MNLFYGEVVDVWHEDGIRFGKVRCGGALKKVPLELLTAITCGDTLLISDGVAISKVEAAAPENHVSGHPR